MHMHPAVALLTGAKAIPQFNGTPDSHESSFQPCFALPICNPCGLPGIFAVALLLIQQKVGGMSLDTTLTSSVYLLNV
jgi:hypothetical protein